MTQVVVAMTHSDSCAFAYKFTGKERDAESGLDNFGARYNSSSLGRFMTPDWAARPTTVPYAVFGDPQSLNLYGYVRNDPVSRADANGHETETYNDGTLIRTDAPMSDSEKQIDRGIMELSAAAIAGPEVLAAGALATTPLQALSVAATTLGVTGTAVNGTVDIAGGLTHTNVDAGTSFVTSATNLVAAAVSIGTRSAAKGSLAADVATVAKAGVDLARGKGVSNPAEVGSSLGGAKDAVQGVYSTVKSIISRATASPPPLPPAPKPPSCAGAGACN